MEKNNILYDINMYYKNDSKVESKVVKEVHYKAIWNLKYMELMGTL